MKLKAIRNFSAIMFVSFMASCSPKMVGTWTVQRFETTQPGKPGVALSNIGTIQFNKNGTGEKNIHYTALGTTFEDQKPFKWSSNDGKYMTIDGEGSEFSKTWIIMTDKKKFQKWKTTDGTNNIQIIELVK